MKVPDQAAGKKVKCPKCAAAIDVPLSGNEQMADSPSVFGAAPPPVPQPARVEERDPDPEPETESSSPNQEADAGATVDEVPPPKSKKKFVMILGGLAAVLLLSCCCLGGGGFFAYTRWFAGERNDKVTKASYDDNVKEGMKLADIEAKLGPGTATKMDDLKAAYKSKKPEEIKDLEDAHRAAISKDADYRWRNGDDFIFVIFDKSAKDNGKAVTIYWVANSSNPPVIIQKGTEPRPGT
jgi:hypothetical protein